MTMNGARETIENGVVIVTENRITAVGETDSVSIPEGAKVSISQAKRCCRAISTRTHMDPTRDDIIPQNNWSLLAHLALGVTTVHNPSSRAAQVFPAAEYQRAGVTLDPEFSQPARLFTGKSTGFDPIESLDDAKAVVARLKAQGPLALKTITSHVVRNVRW